MEAINRNNKCMTLGLTDLLLWKLLKHCSRGSCYLFMVLVIEDIKQSQIHTQTE